MREGFWLNAKTGKYIEIDEHCIFIKNPLNIKKIGAPEHLFDEIKDMSCDRDREKVLRAAMEYDLIRVRGHGNFTTAEFTMDSEKAIWALYDFYDKIGMGPYSSLSIFNLRTNENIDMTYKEFRDKIGEDDLKGILRVAKERGERINKEQKIASKIANEIIK
jgi:hypothetical protein